MNNMQKNVIGYGKGLKKELIELVNKFTKDGKPRRIECCEEFRDKFNPYTENTSNNSVLSRT